MSDKKLSKPARWILITLAATVPAFLVGFYAAYIHPILLPLIPTIALYPAYYLLVSKNRLKEAVVLVVAWALLLTFLMAGFTVMYGEGIAPLVIKGESYKEEMFHWIKTGEGPEGDPRLFIVPKIREIIVFSVAAFVTAGFVALLMGAILLNYMNYYVGSLILHALPGAELQVALLSWPIYAILRVPGYVCLGVALSRLAINLIREWRLKFGEVRKLLYVALVLIVLDFILKGTVANTFYQPILNKIVQV